MKRISIFAIAIVFSNCQTTSAKTASNNANTKFKTAPSQTEAIEFMKDVEKELLRLWINAERASWIKSTYIIDDTSIVAAQTYEKLMEYTARKAKQAVLYDKLKLPLDLRRKFNLLKLSLDLPAPYEASKRQALAKIADEMSNIYATGKYCSLHLAKVLKQLTKEKRTDCLTLEDLSEILAKSRDYNVLLEAWKGWRTVAPSMRLLFAQYVNLANEGAQSLGFSNLGDLWKSRYDMSADDFGKEVDRLWNQVKPLYQQLHCYVRTQLQKTYGNQNVPDGEPIAAHLLGNMWSQDWARIKSLLLPNKSKQIDLERALKMKKIDEQKMVRFGENFFVSLGLAPLPETFWKRSMFTKPKDREVVCHASAWDIDYDKDLRIKMCIQINDEDFSTIHHELGHDYYYYYYRQQPTLFRYSANDGFHEAIGDTIALSITPSYLKEIGLIKTIPKDDISPLMERALDKIAFLPFGLVVDRWRWDVFAGKIKPQEYNKKWWELRTYYQGIKPPITRTEKDFDPGSKYHVAANVPYTRYFLAAILQFQFHRALCKIAGHKGPLHTCSIYGNKTVGEHLKKMLTMGTSKPWPEALYALTGETKIDASAIINYFEPLYAWLKKQNEGQKCGW